MDEARKRILRKYQMAPDARLSSGMEAEVYADGPDRVLKLYTGAVSLTDLHILSDFYNSLDQQRLPYAIPRVYTIEQEDRLLVTIERRLAGTLLASVLSGLTTNELDEIMKRYLAAALALSQIEAPPTFDRHKLFDHNGISSRVNGDGHQFLTRYLVHKLAPLNSYLRRDVPQFMEKVQLLYTILDQPYHGEYRLIHGDFSPGNLLVDDEHHITALLDFGLLTMYGDFLFDIATGWVFLDMYDELKAQVRERYLALLLDRLGENIRGKLYRYVLIYSILSANTYSPNCTDGHYQWCVANLRKQSYWDAIR